MEQTGPVREENPLERRYNRAMSCVFRKTREAFGGLSNMASGYPLVINQFTIRNSEALYQACRYPHRPDIQSNILELASPMSAKLRSKAAYHHTRPDWDDVRLHIMRWCLRVKLAQHFVTFGLLLEETGRLDIIEESRRDRFWGAVPDGSDALIGVNALGRLLMQIRAVYASPKRFQLLTVPPLQIPEFYLLGQPIQEVDGRLDILLSLFRVRANHPRREEVFLDRLRDYLSREGLWLTPGADSTAGTGEDAWTSANGSENLSLFPEYSS